ncbi:MAG: alpha/beta hydrolase [Niabella sp.]
MVKQSIQYKKTTITYWLIGNGSVPVFCIHGYAGNGKMFSVPKVLDEQYTFIALDMPFHGNTVWDEGPIVKVTDMQQILSLILQQCGFPLFTKYMLLGHSMGARISLALYQSRPALVSKLILVAPDGLNMNFWYWLATQTKIGNRFFRFVLTKANALPRIINLYKKLGLIGSKPAKQLANYYHDEAQRKQLYQIWTAFCEFRPNKNILSQLIKQHNTPVRLLYGRCDFIIPIKPGKKFAARLPEQCTISIVSQGGHQLITTKYAPLLIQILNT